MKKFVLLFAALLVASCGEKSLSDSAISKALEEAVETSSLQKRDGIYYQPNEVYPVPCYHKSISYILVLLIAQQKEILENHHNNGPISCSHHLHIY